MTYEVSQWFRPYLLERWRKEVEEAIGDDMTIQDILRMVRTGGLVGYTVMGGGEVVGFALCAITEYPRKRRVRVVVLVGKDMDAWLPQLVERLVEFSQDHGLDGVEFCGRRGFGRKLKGLGAKEYTFMVLEVTWDSVRALQ